MRTARSISTARRVAHGALLSLAVLAAAGNAAAAAPASLTQADLQELSIVASADVTVGGPVSATVTLSDLDPVTETGLLTFSLYGPNDPDCSGDPAFVTVPPVPTAGEADYPSGPFVPQTAGTYLWVASYTGDLSGETVTTTCDPDDPDTVVTVLRAEPTLSTVASGNTPLGGTVVDTATISGGFEPTGTITFRLYGPGDTVCEAAPLTTSTVDLVADVDSYDSAGFVPTVVGDYRWRADYSGDVNNTPAGTACDDPAENFRILTAPDLDTDASADVDLGGAVSDTATLSGSADATGAITFLLFGPDDDECTADPVFTSAPVTVDGDGTYASGAFTPTAAGAYHWVASYSGDAANAGVTTACDDPDETVVVRGAPVTPTLVTDASHDTYVGKRIFDRATLSGGAAPTGTITFDLYGPDDATCARTPVATFAVPVNGNGDYVSGSFRPHTPGTYQWVASYSGDDGNTAVATSCGDPAEQVVVRKKEPYGPGPRP
ncbi:hypothetical protein [Catellatospora vulcania]|uniref:hypothetical protein n=1 Tax=Catellatospora vulcania TaxID=1460450 RepID=UPI0012D3B6DA|nr:hypothetical protein [Catellatospora vulcania]